MRPPPLGEIPLFGTFQNGTRIANGAPTEAAWREVRRLGTIDNLSKIAATKGYDPALAGFAATRVDQALELYQSSKGLSLLSRPIPLYYAALNLLRGMMLAAFGDQGGKSHGLTFNLGSSLLQCNASATKGGTFPTLLNRLAPPATADVPQPIRDYSLERVFRSTEQLWRHFDLLGPAPPLFARVTVTAFRSGRVKMRYDATGISSDEFRERWRTALPWMADQCCDASEPFTIETTSVMDPNVGPLEFCRQHLVVDLDEMSSPLWFDDFLADADDCRVSRLPRYLLGLFILSNVARYEPELLAEPSRRSTDLRFFVEAFLDDAALRVPQLVLQTVEGRLYLFQ